jgi:hypothetical protein
MKKLLMLKISNKKEFSFIIIMNAGILIINSKNNI